jgi:hypothetical protein
MRGTPDVVVVDVGGFLADVFLTVIVAVHPRLTRAVV